MRPKSCPGSARARWTRLGSALTAPLDTLIVSPRRSAKETALRARIDRMGPCERCDATVSLRTEEYVFLSVWPRLLLAWSCAYFVVSQTLDNEEPTTDCISDKIPCYPTSSTPCAIAAVLPLLYQWCSRHAYARSTYMRAPRHHWRASPGSCDNSISFRRTISGNTSTNVSAGYYTTVCLDAMRCFRHSCCQTLQLLMHLPALTRVGLFHACTGWSCDTAYARSRRQ